MVGLSAASTWDPAADLVPGALALTKNTSDSAGGTDDRAPTDRQVSPYSLLPGQGSPQMTKPDNPYLSAMMT
jgi:hypothetical protein